MPSYVQMTDFEGHFPAASGERRGWGSRGSFYLFLLNFVHTTILLLDRVSGAQTLCACSWNHLVMGKIAIFADFGEKRRLPHDVLKFVKNGSKWAFLYCPAASVERSGWGSRGGFCTFSCIPLSYCLNASPVLKLCVRVPGTT